MSLDLDKSAWNRVAFGDVITSITDRVDNPSEAGVERYVGLEHLDPGVMTVQRWDRPEKVEAQKLRFQPGDVIFGRRRAYQKKVARADFGGICSAHALVLRVKPDQVHPDFLPVFLSSDYFLDRAITISVGSLSPTVNWRDLNVQEFDLPPLDEQERIADLLWAVERHRLSVKQTRNCAHALLGQVTRQRMSTMPTGIRLGDITTTRSGPSFAAHDVHKHKVPESVPVLGIPNTKPNGTIDLNGVGYVSGLAASVGKIDESSLVLIRTNGNKQRIGNVYLLPAQAVGHAVSAFQFLMQSNSPADREYLFWVLSEPSMQEQMSEAASGTVGLGNLAVRWLNERQIPWSPDVAERQVVVDELRSLAAAVTRIDCEEDALEVFQTAASAEIFGGD